jgi:hypothetical protein
MIEPLRDFVLIERLEESSHAGRIFIPEIAREKGIKGKVIAVGPGKRVPGEWWKVRAYEPSTDTFVRKWEWFPAEWKHPDVYVGQIVYFNSKWSDFAESHYVEDTPVGMDKRVHLVMENDIYLKLNA